MLNFMKSLVISEVDGCLTTGKFFYTKDGKIMKEFGIGDNEGIQLLKENEIEVKFISSDKIGFEINRKRILDMNCEIEFIPKKDILDFLIKTSEQFKQIYFLGNSLGDVLAVKHFNMLFKNKIIFITPLNGRQECKEYAEYITENKGGEGAFLDMSEWIVKNYVEYPVPLY